MHSKFFDIGPLTVHWYGVMMALGFMAGLLNWAVLGRGTKRTFNYSSDLMFWVMVSGILGARIAYVISEWSQYAQDPLSALRVDQGGLIYYGGFIGSGVALYVFAKRHGERVLDLLDFVITAVPLAHAFGRVGCFLNGCCFGRLCEGFPGVRFPAQSLVWWDHVSSGQILRFSEYSLPVHPVQIYEAMVNLAVYLLLLRHYKRRKVLGSTVALYLLTYPVGRFALEFFRGHERERLFGMPIAQHISIALFAAGIAFLIWSRKGKQPTTSKPAPEMPDSASTAG